MATMNPAIVPSDTRSTGKVEIFPRLRDYPCASDWFVLNSLDLAVHGERVAGEIDFVVIIPGNGIACLEVKGCTGARLRRDDRGFWFYGPNDAGESCGPFRQAADGMHALRHRLVASQLRLARGQLSSGVIFPFAVFRERSAEGRDWGVIHGRCFRSAPISRLMLRLMDAARGDALGPPNNPRLELSAPTVEQRRNIRGALRRGVDGIGAPRDRALLYITTTRPLQRLYIIPHVRIRDEVIGISSAMPTGLGER